MSLRHYYDFEFRNKEFYFFVLFPNRKQILKIISILFSFTINFALEAY